MTREEAIFVLESVITHNSLVFEAKQKALEALKAAPIKHGKWYGCTDGTCMCSWCLEQNEPTNYCPNCGAKMDEVEE